MLDENQFVGAASNKIPYEEKAKYDAQRTMCAESSQPPSVLAVLQDRRSALMRKLDEVNAAIATVRKPANTDLLLAVELSQIPLTR